jgi:adenosylhomocysteine nucleosidase
VLCDALVVVPLKSEFQLLTEAFEALGFAAEASSVGQIPVKFYPQGNFTCAIGGHGKVQFGIQTQFLLGRLPEVKRVLCVGAAGGLSAVKTFDVVVADQTIEHDYTELFDPAPPPMFAGCAETIAFIKSKAASLSFPFSVHHGYVASGDEDVVTSVRGKEIHESTGALAVAWEGAGGARASAFNGKPYLEIRGITDVADNAAAIDFRTNLKKSMENVALFLSSMKAR